MDSVRSAGRYPQVTGEFLEQMPDSLLEEANADAHLRAQRMTFLLPQFPKTPWLLLTPKEKEVAAHLLRIVPPPALAEGRERLQEILTKSFKSADAFQDKNALRRALGNNNLYVFAIAEDADVRSIVAAFTSWAERKLGPLKDRRREKTKSTPVEQLKNLAAKRLLERELPRFGGKRLALLDEVKAFSDEWISVNETESTWARRAGKARRNLDVLFSWRLETDPDIG